MNFANLFVNLVLLIQPNFVNKNKPIKRDWGSDSGKHEQTRECRVNTRLMFPRDHKMETIWSNCKLSPRNKKKKTKNLSIIHHPRHVIRFGFQKKSSATSMAKNE